MMLFDAKAPVLDTDDVTANVAELVQALRQDCAELTRQTSSTNSKIGELK